MVVKFRNTIAPPLHRSIGGLRRQAILTEHGPYKAERTQKAVYIVSWLWSITPLTPLFCKARAWILGHLWGPLTTPHFQNVGSPLAAFI
jgi:hypothetical protein